MEPKRIIIALLATFIGGLALSFALNARQKMRERDERAREVMGPNPIYGELKKIGEPHGVNMDFARKAVCSKSYIFTIDNNPVLMSTPRSYDILLVGDSSVAWGIIPEVIEQITGLKVGVFAMEAMTLNTTAARVIKNLAVYYLKEDGLLVTAFGDWTQEQPAESKMLVATDWMHRVAAMDQNEFGAFMETWKAAARTGPRDEALSRYAGFKEWRGLHARVKNYIGGELFLSLVQINLYLDYIELVTNPKWHLIKKVMLLKLKGYLRWNERSVTMLINDLGIRSRRSESPPDPSYRNPNVAAVAAIIRTIPRRKACLVHFHAQDATSVKLRSIYHSYYRDFAGLIDLGREHPADAGYEMDEKGHMVNTGGMHESVFLGMFLKRHYATLGR